MKVEIDLPDIDGFEYTGEYRRSQNGETYRNSYGKVESCLGGTNFCCFILKKKSPVYRVVGIGQDRHVYGSIHFEPMEVRYVEIQALEDAMSMLRKTWQGENEGTFNALMELIK